MKTQLFTKSSLFLFFMFVIYSITVQAQCLITVNFTSKIPATCFGASDGQLTVGATGGALPYKYVWSNRPSNDTTSTIKGLAAGVYTVTVTGGGCAAGTATATVSQPAVMTSIITSNAAACSGASNGSLSVVASGGTSPYKYVWTNRPDTSATIKGLVTGTYTVSITDAKGCKTNTTATVKSNPTPTITINTANNTICSGMNITLIASGASSYSWNPLGISGNMATVAPSITTTYTVTGKNDTTGCQSSAITTVIVAPTPTLIISTTSKTICAASSTTLNASGASTYSWSWGQGTNTNSSVVVNPTASVVYTVTGTNQQACSNTSTISLTVLNSTNIQGLVKTTASGPVDGLVVLYRFEPAVIKVDPITSGTISISSKFDSIASVAISANGAYTFTSAINADTYLVRAIPTSSTLQATYGTSSIGWKTGTQFVHGCASTSTMNINVIPFVPVVGAGTLSGRIIPGSNFGKRISRTTGQPIGGIIVKGGRNPGGEMFAETETDAAGGYTLTGVPNSDSPNDIFIMVDIPGLDTNGTYYQTINSSNNTITGLDFIVDSAKITPKNNLIGIHELHSGKQLVTIFPNPATHFVSIQYVLQIQAAVKIDLYDMLGKSVKTLLPETQQSIGGHESKFRLDDVAPGLYFVKAIINGSENVIKLSITN